MYRTACSYLLFNLTQFMRCFRTLNTEFFNGQPITVLPILKNSYMFRSQQTANTTFQNNIKMQ